MMLRPPCYYTATVGYAFAYFAWMRSAPRDSYRATTSDRGSTFFWMFDSLQVDAARRNKSDEKDVAP
jgi:hypothetical protein